MDARRFLFCSLDEPLAGDLAWQVHREGHEIRYYVASETEAEVADGFLPKTDDWRADVDWADVVVFDDIRVDGDLGTGELAEELHADGTAVVGGTPATDRLEDDRGYAMEMLADHGVETLPHREFTDFGEAVAYVEDNPDLAVHRGYQVGVRICVPPFPFDDRTFDESSRNAAVVFEDPEKRAGVHIEDVKNVNGQWRVAGTSGVVLVVTGKGQTMRAARADTVGCNHVTIHVRVCLSQ